MRIQQIGFFVLALLIALSATVQTIAMGVKG